MDTGYWMLDTGYWIPDAGCGLPLVPMLCVGMHAQTGVLKLDEER